MIKQLVIPFVLVAAFIVAVGLYLKRGPNLPFAVSTPAPVESLKTLKISGNSIRVEIADTDEKRARGLSGRTVLEDDRGMLFTFDSQNLYPAFWMKDMKIALDIVWINDGRIVQIDKNIPAPEVGVPDSQLAHFTPKDPVDYVLEVNAGFSDKKGIEVSDTVDFSGI